MKVSRPQPRFIIGSCVTSVVVLAGCNSVEDRSTIHYPSPDASVEVRVYTVEGEGPTALSQNTVTLEGLSSSAQGAQAPAESVTLGSFTGMWSPASIAWTSASTVNVCPLSGVPRLVRSATILTRPGVRRTFAITTDCPSLPHLSPG